MPSIILDNLIDAEFLAESAGLDAAWSVEFSPEEGRKFSFLYTMVEAVSDALENYPTNFFAHQVDLKLETLAKIRRQKELNGPNGLSLDDKTVARLTAAAVGLLIDQSRQSVRWEISRGIFQTIPRNNILQLAVGAVNIVQACFDNVYAKTELIKDVVLQANTLEALEDALEELESIDITTGWPS